MSTELERALVRELDEIASGIHVPPMPALPSDPAVGRAHPFATRLRRTLLVAAAVLLVGGVAAVVVRPSSAPVPAGPPPTDTTISTSAPTVPYVIDQRLYVDGTQVPGTWWSVESAGRFWLAQQSDGSWWYGSPGLEAAKVEAQLDQPPVISPDGRYIAFVSLQDGAAMVTGFETKWGGEGFGGFELPSIDGDGAVWVRAVRNSGDVIVQGRQTSLLWQPLDPEQPRVDLSQTAPDQQVLAGTSAGLVVVDGMDAGPQSTEPYVAEVSANGTLTKIRTLPTYDDLEFSPGGRSWVRSPSGTLGGEVTSVATLRVRVVAGGEEATLEAPDGGRFAVGGWTWEDDQSLIAVVIPKDGAQQAPLLARCLVTVGECRTFVAPSASLTQRPTVAVPNPTVATDEYSPENTLAQVVRAVVVGDRAHLLDPSVIGDAEWEQLVDWSAGGDGNGAGCRDNGSGTRDCEIEFEADPDTTYYAILEPAANNYGWRVTYVGIAHG